jgi:periplasmic divalent cation tolerance protein
VLVGESKARHRGLQGIELALCPDRRQIAVLADDGIDEQDAEPARQHPRGEAPPAVALFLDGVESAAHTRALYQVLKARTRENSSMTEFVLAVTTFPKDFDTTALAHDLVGAGLAACVNILPGIRSIYIWNGVPHADEEQQLLIKTTTSQVDPLWEVLRSRHPYEVPEFLVIPVIDGSDQYLQWVDRNVGPQVES